MLNKLCYCTLFSAPNIALESNLIPVSSKFHPPPPFRKPKFYLINVTYKQLAILNIIFSPSFFKFIVLMNFSGNLFVSIKHFVTSLICGPYTIISIKGFLGEDCGVG